MKKRTISTLKAIFGSKKGKRRQSTKCSRSPSPEEARAAAPGCPAESFGSAPRPPPSPPVPTNPVAPVAPEPPGPVKLIPCAVCGRTFVPQSLSKHVKICEKMAAKRRKTFDSSRQRREGTDLEQFLPKNFGLPENSPFLEKSPPNTAKVAPKPKPQDKEKTSHRTTVMKPAADLQKCPHCNRAFGMRAFERHVEWCADKAKILPAAPAQPPAHLADAKQRLNARTRYKAPLARRRSSQTREKSSNSRSASVESTRGASPPPPPREFGDCRNRRNRASESMSSNDCHDDTPPHVPVIRNSRTSQKNSSGDANVKARQARLAKDLSSSRTTQEPNPPAVQHSSTDPDFKKSPNKPVNKISVKKQQQLKKLEEIANKYKERQAKAAEDKEKKVNERKRVQVLKRVASKKLNENEDCSEQSETKEPVKGISKPITPKPISSRSKFEPINAVPDAVPQDKMAQGNAIKKRKKCIVQITKENSMSIDSLEGCVTVSGNDKICQSIGINTELLCVPCVIHENLDANIPNSASAKKKNKASFVDRTELSTRKLKARDSDEKLELLYKNLTMVSSCDIQAAVSSASTFSKSNKFTPEASKDNLVITDDDGAECDINININFEHNTESNTTYSQQIHSNEDFESDPHLKASIDFSAENFEEVEDHDLSAEHFEDSYEHDASGDDIEKSEGDRSDNNETESIEIGCRHGSGDTYTKFTENPADLEEFLNITDKMISSHNFNQNEIGLEIHIDSLHTPRTNSLETINDKDAESETPEPKQHFSDTLEHLKSDFKELLSGAGDKIDSNQLQQQIEANNDVKTKTNVSDMEHITVYGIKFFEQKESKEIPKFIDEPPKLKLPAITENNRPEQKLACNKKRIQNIYKSNRKFTMLGEKNRDDVDNKTFIVQGDISDSDVQSISSEAPPFKLPRIENKRIDDTYDPFVSAARQMKELLSSDTNLPKKPNSLNSSISSKDHSRTLPILRPAKDKTPLSQLRTENSKMIKDTLNKTYQKTPTLQRMKSFGSTINDNSTSLFGGRCSSFRINKNDKKPSPKLNTTFTKSSKENISMADKTNISFNRNNNLNRSFSSYTASSYSTPKLKDKIPKIATSMYHSFQRTTISQPIKLDKIKTDDEKKKFVNLDAILLDDNSSMTDSNYIDPRLINENDNLPINVNTILNNPDIISSMESLLTTENLPSKFDSFSKIQNQNCELNGNIESPSKSETDKINNNNDTNKLIAPIPIENLDVQYEKIMSSLEESIASKKIARDEATVFGEFDLEEFMTTFDEEIHKRKCENKRTCSSTTRVVRQAELASNHTSAFSSVCSTPKSINPSSNALTPITNSKSFNFSSNNIVSESIFPSSIKRSNSILDSIHKKNAKPDSGKSRHKSDQHELDRDLMQSLNDFDKFYESEKNEINQSNRDHNNYNTHNGLVKKDSRTKMQRRSGKSESSTNGNFTPNGKSSNDSAYSSLNRISPSKLSLMAKEPVALELPPSDSSSHKDERSGDSDEFLAMERCAERDARAAREADQIHDARVSSRASSRRSPMWRARGSLSSSGSEASLAQAAPRPPRFCHECGSKFPLDSAKFCVQCGVKRLVL